jgi:apoptosis-inducing factor 2
VETAGELGHYLNGKAGWFSSEPKNIKTAITLVTSGPRLVPILRPALGKKAETYLNKVGVKVIYNTSVNATVPERAGRLDEAQESIENVTAPATVTLSDGQVLEADLYIPAYGLIPNTEFLPKTFLTDKGKVAADKFLRVPAAGPRVYALGDVASVEDTGNAGGIFELFTALPVVVTNIKRDLLHDANVATDEDEEEGKKTHAGPPGKDRPFEYKPSETLVVPVGQSNGVGAVFGWKLPNFVVWLLKTSNYLTFMENPHPKGGLFKSESKWKEG